MPPGEDPREEPDDRSRKEAVDEARSFEGIFDCDVVAGEPWELPGKPKQSGSALTRATGDPDTLPFFDFLLGEIWGDSGLFRLRVKSLSSAAFFPFAFVFPLKSVLSSEAFPPSEAGEAERPASDACFDLTFPRTAPLRVVLRPMHELR